MAIVLQIVIGVNLLAVVLMWWDKRAAERRGWRVPESNLFLLALLGASPTIWWLMGRLHHKNKKAKFRGRIITIIVFQVIISIASIFFLNLYSL